MLILADFSDRLLECCKHKRLSILPYQSIHQVKNSLAPQFLQRLPDGVVDVCSPLCMHGVQRGGVKDRMFIACQSFFVSELGNVRPSVPVLNGSHSSIQVGVGQTEGWHAQRDAFKQRQASWQLVNDGGTTILGPV